MPLKREVLQQFPNPVFVETGTYIGEAVALALELGFQRVYTTDVDKRYTDLAFNKYMNDPRVQVSLGDSGDLLPTILGDAALAGITGPFTFWLDAHPLVIPMYLFQPRFPLMRELIAISRMIVPKGTVILIDDMRTFGVSEQDILEVALHQMWPSAKTYRADGIEKNDVLVCDMR